MKETSKAMQRRWRESDEDIFPWRIIMSGRGLDIGSGDDPLTCATAINLPDGAGDDITEVLHPCLQGTFDYVHGSQVLEHMLDPIVAFKSWLKMLRPKGYIIATVPEATIYEQGHWPSKWNQAHRTRWELGSVWLLDDPIKLPGWFVQFSGIKLRLCRLVDTNYNYELKDVDQTAAPYKAEAFIEFVVQKE